MNLADPAQSVGIAAEDSSDRAAGLRAFAGGCIFWRHSRKADPSGDTAPARGRREKRGSVKKGARSRRVWCPQPRAFFPKVGSGSMECFFSLS